MPTRRYELKERARRQEETRRRIVDATVALHREVGPARTTIAEVARRAGVGRVTVYNHFPDEAALLGACSAQFVAESPPPDPTRWAAIADAGERTRAALTELYAYYRANADMIANVSRDAALIPALAEILSASAEHQDAMRAALAGRRASRARRAAIGLALAFATWQQLTHAEGLSDLQAATLMATTIANA
jgi:AcrR family transcriptional regulator